MDPPSLSQPHNTLPTSQTTPACMIHGYQAIPQKATTAAGTTTRAIEYAEIELVRTALVPIQTNGILEYEAHEFWAQPRPGVVYPTAPGPPPYPSWDPRAHGFIESEPFRSLARDMARRAINWAETDVSCVWIRVTDSGQGNVSADALFLVNNKMMTPFHIHPSAEKQRILLTQMATLWRRITTKGSVGVHHPGDIVVQVSRDMSVTLAGIDWKPHRCETPGRRRLWLNHFSRLEESRWSKPNATAGPSSRVMSASSSNVASISRTMEHNYTVRDRPTVTASHSDFASTSRGRPNATAGPSTSTSTSTSTSHSSTASTSRPRLSFVGPSGDLSSRTHRWLQSIEPMLALMLSNILSWSPTRGRIHRLYIWLIHLNGRGPLAWVELKDVSRVMITNTVGPWQSDPEILQSHLQVYWDEMCRGTPGIDHPSAMRLVGTPRGGEPCTVLVADGVWPESALEPEARAVIERRYASRPSTWSSHSSNHQLSLSDHSSNNHTPSLNSLNGSSTSEPRHAPRSPAPAARLSSGSRDVDFMTSFRPTAHKMMDIAQAWPPKEKQISEIRVILAADHELGLAGYTLITGIGDEALDKCPSITGEAPHVLQETVLRLLAEYCHKEDDLPSAIAVQVHPNVPGVDVRAMWEEGEEALRGMGVTLHYLWQMFHEWGNRAASLPWPKRGQFG